MRIGRMVVLLNCAAVNVLLFGCVSAQSPTAGAPQVHGNLSQVMRGILFPNSNVIFAAQSLNPAEVKQAADPSLSTDPLAGAYGGWEAVQNSALALSESASLLTIAGRKCANGRAVPMDNPDWAQFVQGLRDAGMSAYKAAETKNQDGILDAAEKMTTACGNCHEKYRDKSDDADRCM